MRECCFYILITTLKIDTAIANLVRTKLKKWEQSPNDAKSKSHFGFFLHLPLQPEPTECPSKSSDLASWGDFY